MDDFDQLLERGRDLRPDLAADEVAAAERLRQAIATGAIVDGAHALADWIDARVTAAVVAQLADGQVTA